MKWCQGERDLLRHDLHKWDLEKTRLQRKMLSLEEEKNGLSESLKAAKARVKDLDKEVNKLTTEVVTEFDRGFDTALSLLQVLHP